MGLKRFEWRGFDPDNLTADYTPFDQHPRVINQNWITSWNNKQARGYRAADGNFGYSAVYRSSMLDDQIEKRLAGGPKMTLPKLIDSMEEAGTTDLRGAHVLPLALRILGRQSGDPKLRSAISTLRAWYRSGAQRRDKDRNGVYDHSDAVRIMDAWWPLLMHAEFEPSLGKPLFDSLESQLGLDNAPNNHGDHLGSAYQDGWYGYAVKDLSAVLGDKMKAPYSRVYCGRGKRAACRRALASSLRDALDVPASKLYGGDAVCKDAGMDGSQWCYDAVRMRPLGAVSQPLIHWINRPTFQQAVEVQGRAR
jgi:hypothetical protein